MILSYHPCFSERETSHDVRGTSVLRRPERSVDLESSSPGLDSKKIRMILSYHPCFSERETGLEVDVPLTNPVKSRKGEHAIPTVFKVYSTF